MRAILKRIILINYIFMFFMNFMYFFRKYYNNIIRNELAKQKIYKQTKENSGLK